MNKKNICFIYKKYMKKPYMKKIHKKINEF